MWGEGSAARTVVGDSHDGQRFARLCAVWGGMCMIMTFVRLHLKPLLFKGQHNTIGEAQRVKLQKWSRVQGRAAFLWDRMALRKTLALCPGCVQGKLPKKWRAQYDYVEILGFHAEGACDLCREETSVTLYTAAEGVYGAYLEHDRPKLNALRYREQETWHRGW